MTLNLTFAEFQRSLILSLLEHSVYEANVHALHIPRDPNSLEHLVFGLETLTRQHNGVLDFLKQLIKAYREKFILCIHNGIIPAHRHGGHEGCAEGHTGLLQYGYRDSE